MSSQAAHLPSTSPVTQAAIDGIVVMRGMSWWQYETILAVRGDAAGVRIAYANGELEIMSPSARHEEIKTVLARLIEVYADSVGIRLYGRGSMTTKAPELERGAEPDECYVLDPKHTKHDLVVEVALTSGGINKLDLYRALGAAEVWFWVDDALEAYVLERGAYVKRQQSKIFPNLDLAMLVRFVRLPDQVDAVWGFRAALVQKT